MKVYYEVYENAIITRNGRKVKGNKLILTTKNRAKALDLYEEDEANRWVEEITDYGSGESTQIITE